MSGAGLGDVYRGSIAATLSYTISASIHMNVLQLVHLLWMRGDDLAVVKVCSRLAPAESLGRMHNLDFPTGLLTQVNRRAPSLCKLSLIRWRAMDGYITGPKIDEPTLVNREADLMEERSRK